MAENLPEPSGPVNRPRPWMRPQSSEPPFRLVSTPAEVWNECSVARRLGVMPGALKYWTSRPDVPPPVLVRNHKRYWDPRGVEAFCRAEGL